jgi:hypothetical protein
MRRQHFVFIGRFGIREAEESMGHGRSYFWGWL